VIRLVESDGWRHLNLEVNPLNRSARTLIADPHVARAKNFAIPLLPRDTKISEGPSRSPLARIMLACLTD
jgi:hypothetical protein